MLASTLVLSKYADIYPCPILFILDCFMTLPRFYFKLNTLQQTIEYHRLDEEQHKYIWVLSS